MHATADTNDVIFGHVSGRRVMRGVMRRYGRTARSFEERR
jgi:hypothetical protein